MFLDSDRSEEFIDFIMMFFIVIKFSGSRSYPIITYDTSKDSLFTQKGTLRVFEDFF